MDRWCDGQSLRSSEQKEVRTQRADSVRAGKRAIRQKGTHIERRKAESTLESEQSDRQTTER
eukprot:6200372-Pleurochrysis_carterae.AAC.2